MSEQKPIRYTHAAFRKKEPDADEFRLSEAETLWATIAHMAGVVGLLLPLGNVLGPLIVWLIKRHQMDFVDAHGKEALNFQLTVLIGFVVSIAAVFAASILGVILLLLTGLAALIYPIIAALRANNGEHYEYPYALRLLK